MVVLQSDCLMFLSSILCYRNIQRRWHMHGKKHAVRLMRIILLILVIIVMTINYSSNRSSWRAMLTALAICQ